VRRSWALRAAAPGGIRSRERRCPEETESPGRGTTARAVAPTFLPSGDWISRSRVAAWPSGKLAAPSSRPSCDGRRGAVSPPAPRPTPLGQLGRRAQPSKSRDARGSWGARAWMDRIRSRSLRETGLLPRIRGWQKRPVGSPEVMLARTALSLQGGPDEPQQNPCLGATFRLRPLVAPKDERERDERQERRRHEHREHERVIVLGERVAPGEDERNER
jgi:hypothetical protein